MKKIIATLSILFAAALALHAIPARPGQRSFTQPDGSKITLVAHGDEWGHWFTDAQGRVVRKDADGFYREHAGETVQSVRAAAKLRRQAISRSRRQSPTHVAFGQKRFLVILVEFSDLSFTASSDINSAIHNLLNEPGYSVNGGTGSARDFYYDNSHGVFDPVFDVFGPVKLTNTKAHYGANDDKYDQDLCPEDAVIEGCKALNSEIDFTRYDNDGDGEVDLVFMYYAGLGEADSDDADAIWPHQWELSSAGKSLSLDGKKIDRYACTNEIEGPYSGSSGKLCGIGTACHEFGHAMGLPDFYDTDYDDNGYSAGLFSFSTMDGGAYNNDGRTPPYFNIEERILLGWLDESALQSFSKSGPVTLTTVDDNVAYKTSTDTDGEYFVYECRGSNGWDRHLPAHGLIVYHVDKSSRKVSIGSQSVTARELWDNWAVYNAVNENGTHPCFYVVPAADQENLLFGYKWYSSYQAYYFDSSKSVEIPFPGSKNVTGYTAKSWNGVESEITLSDIAYASDVVTFNVTVPSVGIDYAMIDNPGNGSYTAGSPFELNLIDSDTDPVGSVSWTFDGAPASAPSVILTAGWHTVQAAVVTKSGARYTVELEINVK